MVRIDFFTFNKRENSTLRPGAAGSSFSCVLKEPCSLINPSITLNLGTQSNPVQYNYCYIPDFSRYYFVREWTYSSGLWIADLICDTLASWRPEIGASTQYVARSSHEWDGKIIDMLYPTKFGATYTEQAPYPSTPWPFANRFTDGCYVIGIINGDTSGIGAVSYYVFSNSEFRDLCGILFGSTSWLNFTFADISEEVLKSIFNPFEYIVSCFWLPCQAPVGAAMSSLQFGWWTLSGVSCHRIADRPLFEYRLRFSIPKHPTAASRGQYLNAEPFSRYLLDIRPWGFFQLDAGCLVDRLSLFADIRIDCCTGSGVLQIATSDTNVLEVHETMCAVPIQLAQIYRDYLGMSAAAAKGTGDTLMSAILGDWGGAISSAATGIISTVQASAPRMMSKGSNGSIVDFSYSPRLRAEFYPPVDDSLDNRGRPLCQERVLSTLPGYQLIVDADLALPATADEIRTIKDYMEGGYYYE